MCLCYTPILAICIEIKAVFCNLQQLMGEEPDLDPDITREFFEKNILQFDATLLSENGMK